MRRFFLTVFLLAIAALIWSSASQTGRAQGQQDQRASMMRIVGLGQFTSLPTESDGTSYLPVHSTDRQMTLTAEQWANSNNEVAPLLWNGTILPTHITICGHKLSMIQGGLRTSATDETVYFPVTVSATGLAVPNDGCFAVTPVAYLRIKGITTIPRLQLPSVTVWARY